LDAHLAGCVDCRRYRDDCHALWSALENIPVAAPASDARRIFANRLASETHGKRPPRDSKVRRTLLAAAGLVIAAAIGYTAGSARTTSSAPRTAIAANADTTPRFLLLLYDTDSINAQSSDQMAKTIAEYAGWARGLRDAGQLVTAEKLTDDSGLSFGPASPDAAGDRLGGFFLIRASDLAEARRIAAQCPHVKHGGRVELRAIQPT